MAKANVSSRPSKSHYDLVVIGSGPAGHRGSVQSAKLGKSVLVIEKDHLGGACLHTGTIPSKTLRELALACVPGDDTLPLVMKRARQVIEEEVDIIDDHFVRNKIEYVVGTASLASKNKVRIKNQDSEFSVECDFVLIATGTRPRRIDGVNFDAIHIFDSDTVLGLSKQPRTMLVLGAGVIGCEYASIYARMGIRVTLVEKRDDLFPTIDKEVVAALMREFVRTGIDLRLGTDFSGLQKVALPDRTDGVAVKLSNVATKAEETRVYDAVLFCSGRSGNFETLNLAAADIKASERGFLSVNDHYQTSTPNIYAAGDIIGPPSLAAASSEQGRLAALHMFTGENVKFPDSFPYGIYTIPEISSVGVQEADLIKRRVKYVVGHAYYRELARGKMINDENGFLKILVHQKTERIIGVHVIGTGATELVHIGQVALALGAHVDFFVDNVFNYPTLAEAYKVAAHNALNKLKALKNKTAS